MQSARSLRTLFGCITVATLLVGGPRAWADDADYARQRAELVRVIERDVRETSLYLHKRVLDARVMAAIASVPRHLFVPEPERRHAYDNRPLPIGHGQTISQPYIVALMTDLMQPQTGDRVLEIGTGSGYQAAVLSGLVAEVFTIEIVEPLGRRAGALFGELALGNVRAKIGDGYYGWPEHAPFDAIVVTAAGDHIPPPLIQQLKPGGRMVIPVGSRFMVQQLVVVDKDASGQVTTRQVLPVRFVPLTGAH